MNDIIFAFDELKNKIPKDGIIIYGGSTSIVEKKFDLKFPGKHYQINANLAAAMALKLGIGEKIIKEALESYSGVWRRFEKIYEDENITIIDDYGHHPTEIKATLKAAREMHERKRIWCVFQPHLFSRTKILLKEFSESFNDADEIIIAEIYAAREKNEWNISSEDLVSEIKKRGKSCVYISELQDVPKFLEKKLKKGDLVLTMGAGDTNKVALSLATIYNNING